MPSNVYVTGVTAQTQSNGHHPGEGYSAQRRLVTQGPSARLLPGHPGADWGPVVLDSDLPRTDAPASTKRSNRELRTVARRQAWC